MITTKLLWHFPLEGDLPKWNYSVNGFIPTKVVYVLTTGELKVGYYNNNRSSSDGSFTDSAVVEGYDKDTYSGSVYCWAYLEPPCRNDIECSLYEIKKKQPITI